jgi:hypothetical protein
MPAQGSPARERYSYGLKNAMPALSNAGTIVSIATSSPFAGRSATVVSRS